MKIEIYVFFFQIILTKDGLHTSDYCNDISRQDQCQAKKKNLNFRVPFLTLEETQKKENSSKKRGQSQDRDQNELHLKEIWLKPQ